MNNCYELIQNQPNPPPVINSPPPVLEWTALLSVIAAGVSYVGRAIIQTWQSKEQGESELMKGLITHMQALLNLMVADAKESKAEIIRHIDLKESVVRLTTQVEEKVNRALGGQTDLYIESLRNQTTIMQKIDALHKRGDELEVVVTQMLEKSKNANFE